MKSSLQNITKVFLSDQSEPGDLYTAAHALHDIFSKAAGIAAGNITDHSIHLPSGTAVSPVRAAHCLLEFKRTAVFLRGIYKAIRKLQNAFKGERINILYAGCGPYGTLLTPLTAMFGADEIGIILMDINLDALRHVTQLYGQLGLNDYIIKTVQDDAATYRIDTACQIHLAISETMQNGLRSEPQVAVMLNLIPQLQPEALFIPEEITVSAVMLSAGEETRSFMEADRLPPRHHLGKVYTIGQLQASEHQETTFEIPENLTQFSDLCLLTDIRVFEDEVLTIYDCCLNLPLKVCKAKVAAGKKISFKYFITDQPGFVHQLF